MEESCLIELTPRRPRSHNGPVLEWKRRWACRCDARGAARDVGRCCAVRRRGDRPPVLSRFWPTSLASPVAPRSRAERGALSVRAGGVGAVGDAGGGPLSALGDAMALTQGNGLCFLRPKWWMAPGNKPILATEVSCSACSIPFSDHEVGEANPDAIALSADLGAGGAGHRKAIVNLRDL